MRASLGMNAAPSAHWPRLRARRENDNPGTPHRRLLLLFFRGHASGLHRQATNAITLSLMPRLAEKYKLLLAPTDTGSSEPTMRSQVHAPNSGDRAHGSRSGSRRRTLVTSTMMLMATGVTDARGESFGRAERCYPPARWSWAGEVISETVGAQPVLDILAQRKADGANAPCNAMSQLDST